MSDSGDLGALWRVLAEYDERLIDQLASRTERVPVDLSKREVGEVCGALLARQTRLGMEFARSPSIWNGHVAPVLLRTMVDVLINLKWILEDQVDRSRKFILYGLGQAKLQVEHRKIQLESEGHDPDEDPVIEAFTGWMESQRFGFLTNVDVGSWSGLSVRDMATEADCLGLLHYSYAPFSAATHSMWHHVGRYNLVPCASPLHRHHLLPSTGPDEFDVHYLEVSAKYVDRAFNFYDEANGIEPPAETAYDWLFTHIDGLGSEDDPEDGGEEE
jgi:uncharacterized protein DUF5677